MSLFGGIFYDYLEGTWDQAKGFLREHLEQLDVALANRLDAILNADGTVNVSAFGNPGAPVPSYLANTGPFKSPRWEKVDVAIGVKNRLHYANLTAAANRGSILGRNNVTPGDWQETLTGSGLQMVGTVANPILEAPGKWSKHFFMMGG